jgi:hypothetical protein
MWYLIADANGLASSSLLSAGQRLIIPNKVTNVHNNTGTFRVYDPGEAIGDTLPTLPNEPAPPAGYDRQYHRKSSSRRHHRLTQDRLQEGRVR